MSVATQLSTDEETFLRRALPHFIAGKSVDESLRAVLVDDARLVTAFFQRGSNEFFPTPDERGYSKFTGQRVGDCIASEMARSVYSAHQVQVPA